MAIQVLDQNTINKIAAGEVIERPSSVVKELVENAIDAGATAITVEIKDGGISLVRITDNGCGIAGDELPLAFLRHSTSKIKSVEDLMSVSSLGFRGEALSSIASVAQVEVITKTAASLTGSRYVIEGGEEKSNEEVGAPEGTTFIVRNLFYNTPVRRKFLKTSATEAGYVNSLIEHISLSHPDISFRFINNNQSKLHTSGNMQLKDIIYNVYGRDIAKNLIEINASTQDIEITGYVGKPAICRGNRTYENYYINGRYIKSAIITKAIEEAYKGFVMMHNYPFTAMHFKINPAILDVNVHPTKMELRFSKNEFVYQFVLNTVRDALNTRELIPEVRVEAEDMHSLKHMEKNVVKERGPEPFEIKRQEAVIAEENKAYDYGEKKFYGKTIKEQEVPQAAEQIELFKDNLADERPKKNYRIIGQLFDTYWLIEFEDKFYMMDQHAAHEKVLYEKTMRRMREKKMTTQMVMPAAVLSLNMREAQILEENMEAFTRLGFEIEDFGGNSIKITGVPAGFPAMDYKSLFLELLDGLVEDGLIGDLDMITDKVASMSCKAAIKGNNRISFDEAKELMEEMMEADNPYNCPHGRPTLIMMSKYEIEKKFHRIV
ncbi:MAG: DNA mismatch repair endonuclease MutL [Eubacteriales bacterium]|nr:DNA mismatch repair endonuclease MutL [Eubacteriales bacterium]